MKQKFTSLDVRGMVTSLSRDSSILGSRVLNIYDLNPKTFVFKLSTLGNTKEFLLVESGVRFHLVDELVKKEAFPSGTAMALRKNLKNKKIEKIEQIANDRIIAIQFGVGLTALRLVVELYAKGNVLLIDASDTIVLVLRQFAYDEDNALKKGQKFPFHLFLTSPGYLLAGSSREKRELVESAIIGTESEKTAVSSLVPFAHPGLVTAALAAQGDKVDRVMNAADWIVEKFKEASESPGGYSNGTDFSPVAVGKNCSLSSGQSFSQCVREFFGQGDKVKEERQLSQYRETVLLRLAKTRSDQETRIVKLRESIDRLQVEADTLLSDLPTVDETLLRLLQLTALGLDWTEISDRRPADCEQLDFEKGRAKVHGVWIEIELTSRQNVAKLFEQKKAQQAKLTKTEIQINKTLLELERQAKLDIAKFEHKINSRKMHMNKRKFWWEKFLWFVSSENVLVLAGRDAQQNELLYKRYLKAKDIWIHADVAGAASVVVKSSSGRDYPPIASLVEAGQFALCLSKAWESKIVTSAYWVFADQVSKAAPSGEYLGTGSFMVRGRKNYLPHARLEMALGLMFLVTEESRVAADGRREERKVTSELVVRDLEADRLVE